MVHLVILDGVYEHFLLFFSQINATVLLRSLEEGGGGERAHYSTIHTN